MAAKREKINWRLGLDIGTNSIGWSVLRLGDDKKEIKEIVNAGARIFSDGRADKTKSTLAAERRAARGARRRRDRFLQRQKKLIDTLTQAGLFPESKDERLALQKKNPLELRAKALTEELHPFEVGRALFHINQRRGFKSNRKDQSEEVASGKVANSIALLLQEMICGDEFYKIWEKQAAYHSQMQNSVALLLQEMGLAEKGQKDSKAAMEKLSKTQDYSLGKFLWQRSQEGKQTRARIGAGDKGQEYDVYPNREIYEDEFRKIWEKQATYRSQMKNKALRDKVHSAIFFQRPLKQPKLGKCAYMSAEDRTYRAMPSFQRYRIYQEVNNLTYWGEDGEEHNVRANKKMRDFIVNLLENPSSKRAGAFDSIRRQLKKKGLVEGDIKFNYETIARKELDVNATSQRMQQEGYIGKAWHSSAWPLERQDDFIAIILGEGSDEEIEDKLRQEFGLDRETAEKCTKAHLIDSTANISAKAARLMLTKMEGGIAGEQHFPTQDKAATAVAEETEGFVDPMRKPKGTEEEFEPLPGLPYYGKAFQHGSHIIPGSGEEKDKHDDLLFYGGITNPTVHIALNQIRVVVNELIARYGHPHSIAIELGRELPQGQEYRANISRQQENNRQRNRELGDKLLEEFGQTDNPGNRLRLKLWKEQNELCPYSGEKIGAAALFTSAVEVDHIIPFRDSLDDSPANKVVCIQRANRDKGKKTPWDAFHDHSNYDMEEIIKRANEIKVTAVRYNRRKRKFEEDTFNNKSWRFQEDALGKWREKYGDEFTLRHLNDTRYIGRLTREYLECICHIDRIDVLTGQVTAILRRDCWGLDNILSDEFATTGKNRNDHRHHAIDAIVIGMTTRSMLQKIATQANTGAEVQTRRLFVKNKDGSSPVEPWKNFRSDVETAIGNVCVSHRVNHKKKGRLHEDTAYGIADKSKVAELNKKPKSGIVETDVVVRKAINAFTTRKHVNEIRDPNLREDFLQAFDAAEDTPGKKGKDGVQSFAKQNGIGYLRVLLQKNVQPIRDREGKVYKGYQLGNNWAAEIYKIPSSGKWKMEVVSVFEACQKDFQPGVTRRPQPDAKLVMRLFGNDMLQITDESGNNRLMRVQKMDQNNAVYICQHNLANVAQRLSELVNNELCYKCSASRLMKFNAQKASISPTGRVQIIPNDA